MKRLYATTDAVEVEVLRALLRDRGIESSLDNEGGATLALGLPTGAVPLGINVADEDAAAAAEALAGHFEKQQAADTEDDPEAPAPLSSEESEAFERRVRRGRPRLRFWLAFFWLLPAAVAALVRAAEGDWTAAMLAAGAVLALIAVGWTIHLLAESRVKKKEPAP
jgi:hypothetical protein